VFFGCSVSLVYLCKNNRREIRGGENSTPDMKFYNREKELRQLAEIRQRSVEHAASTSLQRHTGIFSKPQNVF
jgi:hypothetical protein